MPAELRELAERRWAAYAAQARASGLSPPPAHTLTGDVERVWACSDFVAQSCTRDPALVGGLLETDDLARAYSPGAYRRAVETALADAHDEAALMRALRRVRRREMLRIAWRDLGGCADFEETVAETSALADAIIDAALERVYAWSCAELGQPQNERGQPQRLVVFALGKLGAEELNFSSDIDLILAFPEGGRTHGGRRALANEEFFLRLARRLIKILDRNTEDGFLFRVDMRLRPFGTSGPLVSSFNALEDYYQIHGRDWERYALIRARPIAGDIDGGERLLEDLRPFVYRRYLDFGALESLRDMKRLIAQEVQRKGLAQNIKLGPGGIREIEFIGQAFQMVRGGREANLRDRRILKVLERLGERGHLPAHAVNELSAAYRFLRTCEHRLQQAEDRQTHSLPDDLAGRLRVAAGMGFADWARFEHVLSAHRTHVQAQFDQIFAAPQTEGQAAADSLEALWEGSPDAEHGASILVQAGFPDGAAAWEQLAKLKHSYSVRALGKRGRGRMRRLVPLLLSAVANQPDPLATLQRVFWVVESIARRSVYLALLVERPLALSQLVQLCAASPWIARQIARHPVLLDELLDPRNLYAPLDREALESELAARLAGLPSGGDPEQEVDVLRQFKQANVLRVAAADVAEVAPLMRVSDHLTAIAEVCLGRVLVLAWRDVVARHGAPRCRVGGDRRDAGFVIVGYGKLGGIELGYGSDLDLVFLHGSSGDAQHTDGPRSVDNAVFFGRLGQRLIHHLTARTPAGILYEVDSRLRPSGASGLLVSGLEAFEHYQRHEAWTWEHQALVRARAVAGDPELAERFARIRRSVLLAERDPERLRTDVREMRERMRAELGSRARERFEIKQDPGGIADIEFMVQYVALRWPRELGEYLAFTDNIRLLEGIEKAGLLTADDARVLTDAYRAYRARVHALALQEQPELAEDTEFRNYRTQVTRIWRQVMQE
ncbi:MAG: bifunctional [glutamate--ammonia ligase]-adenylyl-L-tyrosine phosphorylase/[glutamate--ammonia-ligase] adenylyltransferase [Gammaproteobacteria bacterium]|nr:bifunctional [glutamate--ammonia ligase]-adenylyl-L-tyrosine phosphorylase/[glutamate--ammonia-ligase] adenylyltransferase [Gammaproteobacteria bacterium]